MLFFDTILSGYGVRFALDREERGRGKSAGLRLYDTNYERVLDYSGFSKGQAWETPSIPAPLGWKKSKFDSSDKPRSFVGRLLGNHREDSNDHNNVNERNITEGEDDIVLQGDTSLSYFKKENWNPSCEDVLTWMPPTPQLLSDATLLLLRLTLNGTIASSNYRWDSIRNAWTAMLDVQRKYGNSFITFEFYPLVSVTASLMATPDNAGAVSGATGRLAKGLHKMGELLNLGDVSPSVSDDDRKNALTKADSYLSSVIIREIVAEKDPAFWLPVTEDSKKKDWKIVLNLLSSAIDGVYNPIDPSDIDMETSDLSSVFKSWEFDVRPALEHAVVYAACKCGDNDSLGLARSICSRGVTLRPNSPEEWWRYSIVLGLLGDEVASEHALQASIGFGGGQGARGGG